MLPCSLSHESCFEGLEPYLYVWKLILGTPGSDKVHTFSQKKSSDLLKGSVLFKFFFWSDHSEADRCLKQHLKVQLPALSRAQLRPKLSCSGHVTSAVCADEDHLISLKMLKSLVNRPFECLFCQTADSEVRKKLFNLSISSV